MANFMGENNANNACNTVFDKGKNIPISKLKYSTLQKCELKINKTTVKRLLHEIVQLVCKFPNQCSL